MTRPFIHVASVSTGKDSQATMLLMIERVGKENCKFVMCDTGNEHDAVFEHQRYLEATLGITIDVLKADFSQEIAGKRLFIARDRRVKKKLIKEHDKTGRIIGRSIRYIRWSNKAKRRALDALKPTGNPFLDLCLWKGRFPARLSQFCTQFLKTIPMVEYQMALVDQGYNVVSWQGVRRDESHNRRNAKLFNRIGPSMYAFRPIIHWTAQQTVDYSTSRGLKLNALYSMGFTRVGCMPCINCSKNELSTIARRAPADIARLADWERHVGEAAKRGESTFFKNPDRDAHLDKRGIHKMVEWAKTSRGGRQFSLLPEEEAASCSSSYGLCE